MDPDAWMTHLTATLDAVDGADLADGSAGSTVGDGGPVAGGGPELGADERDALLDLARIAAHTSERWTAPLSTFLVGLRYAALPADERGARLRALVERLDDPDRA